MKTFEMKEKRKNEKLIEFEQMIVKLKKDFNEAQEELKRLKPVHIFRPNYSGETTNVNNRPGFVSSNNSMNKQYPSFHSNREVLSDNIRTEVLLKTEGNVAINKLGGGYNKLNSSLNFSGGYKTGYNNPRYDSVYTLNNEEKINKTLPTYENFSADNSYLGGERNKQNNLETEINETFNNRMSPYSSSKILY